MGFVRSDTDLYRCVEEAYATSYTLSAAEEKVRQESKLSRIQAPDTVDNSCSSDQTAVEKKQAKKARKQQYLEKLKSATHQSTLTDAIPTSTHNEHIHHSEQKETHPLIPQLSGPARQALLQSSSLANCRLPPNIPYPTEVQEFLQQPFALLALHTCGDLGATVLRLFVHSFKQQPAQHQGDHPIASNLSPQEISTNFRADAVVLVSCCYHLLSESDEPNVARMNCSHTSDSKHSTSTLTNPDENNHSTLRQHALLSSDAGLNAYNCTAAGEYGFPLSQYLQKRAFLLGYRARGNTWRPTDDENTRQEEMTRIKHNRFRAVLETLLYKYQQQQRQSDQSSHNTETLLVGAMPKSFFKSHHTFSEYVKVALSRRLNIDLGMSDSELDQYYLSFSRQLHRLDILNSLQSLLAPLTEAIILYDRALYLLEQGVPEVRLYPLFDPHISPRNMVLWASRKAISSQSPFFS